MRQIPKLCVVSGALAAAFLANSALSRTQRPDAGGLTAAMWQEDIRLLARTLPARHVEAFHDEPEQHWRQATEDLAREVERRSTNARLVGLLQLVARIGDAHTFLVLPEWMTKVPIGFYRFGSEIRVVRAAPGLESTLGARLERVGQTPVADAYARVTSVVAGAENEWFTNEEAPMFLTMPEVLEGLGLIRAGSTTPFELRTL